MKYTAEQVRTILAGLLSGKQPGHRPMSDREFERRVAPDALYQRDVLAALDGIHEALWEGGGDAIGTNSTNSGWRVPADMERRADPSPYRPPARRESRDIRRVTDNNNSTGVSLTYSRPGPLQSDINNGQEKPGNPSN